MVRFAACCAVALLLTVLPPATRKASARYADEFVIMDTTRGRIVVRVFRSLVPYTANNFLDLVNREFYDGLRFHRVESWVVQGGDPNGNGSGSFIDPDTGNPRYLRLEVHPQLGHNQPGMVAMARSANRNSASCQFYIIKRPMPQLNGQYAVFGRVVHGMDAVYSMSPGDRILAARIAQRNDGSNQGSQEQAGDGSSRQRSSPPASQDSGF